MVDVNQGVNEVTITTLRTNEQFLPDPNKAIITFSKNIDSIIDEQGLEGRHISIQSVSVQDSGRKAVYSVSFIDENGNDVGIPDGCTLKIIAPLQVNDAVARRKIIREDVARNITPISQNVISLGVADVYQTQDGSRCRLQEEKLLISLRTTLLMMDRETTIMILPD